MILVAKKKSWQDFDINCTLLVDKIGVENETINKILSDLNKQTHSCTVF